ncbi:uncharacterized protein C8Q71DRAFT_140290 [Rhodofomes roseus]|uniref:Uncharacterized protein n=1 Tax=Rhodofomes roseus TaxID=34475 RepID=A0ABQ8KAA9_9APHY|nr:uncharacterized protein C8Q71DRAFT_140290 [Rhodofomes roseus]KAH9834420.1 hypothetical protein C8Q71DRAFT_140290 [Rhodofomes roseus]
MRRRSRNSRGSRGSQGMRRRQRPRSQRWRSLRSRNSRLSREGGLQRGRTNQSSTNPPCARPTPSATSNPKMILRMERVAVLNRRRAGSPLQSGDDHEGRLSIGRPRLNPPDLPNGHASEGRSSRNGGRVLIAYTDAWPILIRGLEAPLPPHGHVAWISSTAVIYMQSRLPPLSLP